jgi:hypothetical protein
MVFDKSRKIFLRVECTILGMFKHCAGFFAFMRVLPSGAGGYFRNEVL